MSVQRGYVADVGFVVSGERHCLGLDIRDEPGVVKGGELQWQATRRRWTDHTLWTLLGALLRSSSAWLRAVAGNIFWRGMHGYRKEGVLTKETARPAFALPQKKKKWRGFEPASLVVLAFDG